MPFDSFEAQIDALRHRLLDDLPGPSAHLTMAPQHRNQLAQLSVEEKPCRKAGVLVALFPGSDSSTGVLLIKRRSDLPEHAGQIAFPGGRQEHDETLQETALREAYEEIGLDAATVEMLGPLTPIYIPVSNYCVYPYIGALNRLPDLFILQKTEVQHVLTVPVSQLTAPATRRSEIWKVRGADVQVPFFEVNRETIWGATAMILAELLMIMES